MLRLNNRHILYGCKKKDGTIWLQDSNITLVTRKLTCFVFYWQLLTCVFFRKFEVNTALNIRFSDSTQARQCFLNRPNYINSGWYMATGYLCFWCQVIESHIAAIEQVTYNTVIFRKRELGTDGLNTKFLAVKI